MFQKDLSITILLLDRGSDPVIKNRDGLTAYQFEVAEKKDGIAGLIKAYSERKGLKYK